MLRRLARSSDYELGRVDNGVSGGQYPESIAFSVRLIVSPIAGTGLATICCVAGSGT